MGMKLLGIGNALMDVLVEMEDNGLLQELGLHPGTMTLISSGHSVKILERIREYKVSRVAGGSVANTLRGFAQLGGACLYLGKAGRDEQAEAFSASMKESGVGLVLLSSEQNTGVAVTFISPDSERTFATSLSATLDLSSKDLQPELFAGFDWLYGDGYTSFDPVLLKNSLRMAKEAGLKIAFDLASPNVAEEHRELFLELLQREVDLVFANEAEAFALTGKKPEAALRELLLYCPMAVVKLGSEGSLVGSGDKIWKIESVSAIPRDTTGAGDLYAAGFLYGISKNLSPDVCGNIGSLLASRVVEEIGTRISQESWTQILGILKKRGWVSE